tara:strand:+ start:13877 stop:14452 length:576 start_codon:yes stop_codon:yes gene_type:complete
MSVIKTDRIHKTMSIDAIKAATKQAANEENWTLVAEYGVELKFRDNEAKEAAGKAINWADLAKYSAVLPNGGRLGPKSDVAIVVALVSMAQFILRSLPQGQRALDDNEIEAIKSVLASNVLCGRGNDADVKSFNVQVLDNGHLRVIGTPSPASQEDEKGLNVFSCTTTDEGPVKLERHTTTHQVPVQGSAA